MIILEQQNESSTKLVPKRIDMQQLQTSLNKEELDESQINGLNSAKQLHLNIQENQEQSNNKHELVELVDTQDNTARKPKLTYELDEVPDD